MPSRFSVSSARNRFKKSDACCEQKRRARHDTSDKARARKRAMIQNPTHLCEEALGERLVVFPAELMIPVPAQVPVQI